MTCPLCHEPGRVRTCESCCTSACDDCRDFDTQGDIATCHDREACDRRDKGVERDAR